MKPTVVILTKNEEKSIKRCLRHVKEMAHEVLVIDDYSTDKTVTIAREEGARVIQHHLESFAAQRNVADQHVTSDWVMHVDADEVVEPALMDEITALSDQEFYAYYLRRIDEFWGTVVRHGEVASAASTGFIRVYKRGSGTWEGAVHERFVTNVQTRTLAHALIHKPHGSIAEFLASINVYSTMRARELQRNGARASWVSLTIQPIGKFLYTYFARLGFLDGPAGFVYSFMMSFHSFLVRAKLYQLSSQDRRI